MRPHSGSTATLHAAVATTTPIAERKEGRKSDERRRETTRDDGDRDRERERERGRE
jgi:hypothetical protein